MSDAKSSLENQPAAGLEPALSDHTRAVNPISHDLVLQIRILDQLNSSSDLDASDVSVVVRNRSATLFGSVVDDAQRNRAQRLAAEVSGIIEVTNRLKLARAAH
jgi:osmotically-inducible protein OsmY